MRFTTQSFDSTYGAEEVELTISQDDVDDGGVTYRFSGLSGDRRYKCLCTSVVDPLGNAVANDSEVVLTTLQPPPPIELIAYLETPLRPSATRAFTRDASIRHFQREVGCVICK